MIEVLGVCMHDTKMSKHHITFWDFREEARDLFRDIMIHVDDVSVPVSFLFHQYPVFRDDNIGFQDKAFFISEMGRIAFVTDLRDTQ